MGFKIEAKEDYIEDTDASVLVEGAPINLASHLGVAFQAFLTGAPEGSLQIQASCDKTQMPNEVMRWTTISEEIIAGAGSKIFNCRDIYYKWIRLVFVPSGGAGTLAANYTLKGEW